MNEKLDMILRSIDSKTLLGVLVDGEEFFLQPYMLQVTHGRYILSGVLFDHTAVHQPASEWREVDLLDITALLPTTIVVSTQPDNQSRRAN